MDQNDDIAKYAKLAITHCPGMLVGTFKVIEVHFYVALIYLRIYPTIEKEEEKTECISQVDELLRKLKV